MDKNKAWKYLAMAQDSFGNGPKNETLQEHREHCKAEQGNCPFERKENQKDEETAGLTGNERPTSEECLIYNGETTPLSKIKMGSPQWMAFNALKYQSGNMKKVMRDLAEWRDTAEEWGQEERVKHLNSVMEILRGGATLSANTQTSKPPKRAPLGRKVTQKEWNAAKEEFGTTDNPTVIGYILPDGDALDFSGGGDGTVRGTDHRAIGGVIERKQRENVNHPGMVDAVLSGAIRYMAEANSYQIGKQPTEAQWDKIWDIADSVRRAGNDKRIYIDLCEDGDFYETVSASYSPKTSISKIKSDVDEFFKNGTCPTGT